MLSSITLRYQKARDSGLHSPPGAIPRSTHKRTRVMNGQSSGHSVLAARTCQNVRVRVYVLECMCHNVRVTMYLPQCPCHNEESQSTCPNVRATFCKPSVRGSYLTSRLRQHCACANNMLKLVLSQQGVMIQTSGASKAYRAKTVYEPAKSMSQQCI